MTTEQKIIRAKVGLSSGLRPPTVERNELALDIETYLAERNANLKPYKWKAEGAEILSKIRRARAALDKAGVALVIRFPVD
jgi:hypothetical protein